MRRKRRGTSRNAAPSKSRRVDDHLQQESEAEENIELPQPQGNLQAARTHTSGRAVSVNHQRGAARASRGRSIPSVAAVLSQAGSSSRRPRNASTHQVGENARSNQQLSDLEDPLSSLPAIPTRRGRPQPVDEPHIQPGEPNLNYQQRRRHAFTREVIADDPALPVQQPQARPRRGRPRRNNNTDDTGRDAHHHQGGHNNAEDDAEQPTHHEVHQYNDDADMFEHAPPARRRRRDMQNDDDAELLEQPLPERPRRGGSHNDDAAPPLTIRPRRGGARNDDAVLPVQPLPIRSRRGGARDDDAELLVQPLPIHQHQGGALYDDAELPRQFLPTRPRFESARNNEAELRNMQPLPARQRRRGGHNNNDNELPLGLPPVHPRQRGRVDDADPVLPVLQPPARSRRGKRGGHATLQGTTSLRVRASAGELASSAQRIAAPQPALRAPHRQVGGRGGRAGPFYHHQTGLPKYCESTR
ncbi:hypothetical protein QAD02_011513 [Eretmocerus hayati]|uniref:Uncharacterized protein n=1 Tax=Eretmocerus hayati TaxID=131215 RepID=A0ACC2NX85_9HYME|nr:hypothetical protein QAD02_011513 [Eretmocerus hayati]